ncbi:MAG TPA: hypothetical protein V6D14_33185 [Coleofasciculaceae cyanobacterium]
MAKIVDLELGGSLICSHKAIAFVECWCLILKAIAPSTIYNSEGAITCSTLKPIPARTARSFTQIPNPVDRPLSKLYWWAEPVQNLIF